MSETLEREAEAGTAQVKPWTVKGIAPEERNAAIAAAERDGMTIGEWLTRAIRSQIQADRQSDRVPVVVEGVRPSSDRQSDLADLERMIALAEKISQANGSPIPAGITRAAYSLVRDRLKELKGGRVSRTAEGVSSD